MGSMVAVVVLLLMLGVKVGTVTFVVCVLRVVLQVAVMEMQITHAGEADGDEQARKQQQDEVQARHGLLGRARGAQRGRHSPRQNGLLGVLKDECTMGRREASPHRETRRVE